VEAATGRLRSVGRPRHFESPRRPEGLQQALRAHHETWDSLSIYQSCELRMHGVLRR
jgi:hypothetical protein